MPASHTKNSEMLCEYQESNKYCYWLICIISKGEPTYCVSLPLGWGVGHMSRQWKEKNHIIVYSFPRPYMHTEFLITSVSVTGKDINSPSNNLPRYKGQAVPLVDKSVVTTFALWFLWLNLNSVLFQSRETSPLSFELNQCTIHTAMKFTNCGE